MSEALAILEGHLSSLDLRRLAAYAVRLGVAPTVKRLGWALESSGTQEEVLAPPLAFAVKMTQPLDPRRARKGPVIPRWRLVKDAEVREVEVRIPAVLPEQNSHGCCLAQVRARAGPGRPPQPVAAWPW